MRYMGYEVHVVEGMKYTGNIEYGEHGMQWV